MINEFINGFTSVSNFYFLGKLFGISMILLIELILLTSFLEICGFLKGEDNTDENRF